MPLKHRLARLERVVAARKRAVEELVDPDETWRHLQELHADPLRLALIRSAWGAESDPLPEGVSREELLRERVARVEAYGGPAPEGAAVILQYHLERLEPGPHVRAWFPVDLLTAEDLQRRRSEMRADPVAMEFLNEILKITRGDYWDLRKKLTLPGVPELLARLKEHRASKGAIACA